MTDDIEKAIAEIQADWMSVDGVVGIGSTIDNGEPAILVIIERSTPAITEKIPTQFKGLKVKLLEGGEISAQDPDK